MKHIKSHITKALGILLALAVLFAGLPVNQVQAASTKVTAAKYKEGKKDYPKISTGSYRIKVKTGTWEGTDACVRFKAKKAGTYTFKLKGTDSIRLTYMSFWKNQAPDGTWGNPGSTEADKVIGTEDYEYDKEHNSSALSVKFKLKKGDTVYISMGMMDWMGYTDGKLTLSVKKTK